MVVREYCQSGEKCVCRPSWMISVRRRFSSWQIDVQIKAWCVLLGVEVVGFVPSIQIGTHNSFHAILTKPKIYQLVDNVFELIIERIRLSASLLFCQGSKPPSMQMYTAP